MQSGGAYPVLYSGRNVPRIGGGEGGVSVLRTPLHRDFSTSIAARLASDRNRRPPRANAKGVAVTVATAAGTLFHAPIVTLPCAALKKSLEF